MILISNPSYSNRGLSYKVRLLYSRVINFKYEGEKKPREAETVNMKIVLGDVRMVPSKFYIIADVQLQQPFLSFSQLPFLYPLWA